MDNTKLAQAVYKLGQVSANPPACNAALLQKLIDIAASALGVEFASIAVFEHGVERVACAVQVSGPWPVEACNRIGEVARWDIKERPEVARLATLDRNQMYRRTEIIDEKAFKSSRLYSEVLTPMRLTGDSVVGVFHRADGVELMLTFQAMDDKAAVPEDLFRKAQAVASFVAQCWSSAWRAEPGWMKALKPQSRRVLDDVLEGYDDDQIAERTGLTYHSVRAHLKRLFRDADVRSRLHLMQTFRGERHGPAIEALRVAGPAVVIAGKSGPQITTVAPAKKVGLSIAG
jgi:DNA-binding CsgD family transcriptional regulator